MAKLFKRIINTRLFNNVILILILCAGVLTGLATYPSIHAEYGYLIDGIDAMILCIFVVEIFLKMGAESPRPWRYFYDSWNVFDFCIVAFSLLPIAFAQFGTVLRLTRVLRVFRLVSQLRRLQLLVATLFKSLPSMSYVTLLMFLLFYIYATIGTFAFSKNDPVYFGNLQRSMLTLFRSVTLEDWTDLMYTQMYGSDKYVYEFPDVKREPEAFPVFAVVYFVSFILIGSMIIVNLFIGIIINSLMDVREEQAQESLIEKMKIIPAEITDIYQKLFPMMTAKQFINFWQMGTIFEADDSVIIVEGEKPNHLLLILHGEVEIRYNDQIVGHLSRGQFIAEMSFITGKAATATVKAKDRVQYIAWLQSEIKALETSDPQIFIQIQGTLGRDLIEKLVVTEQAKV